MQIPVKRENSKQEDRERKRERARARGYPVSEHYSCFVVRANLAKRSATDVSQNLYGATPGVHARSARLVEHETHFGNARRCTACVTCARIDNPV